MMSGNKNPILPIIAKFGGQCAMARALNTGQATIWDWMKNGRVPAQKIPLVIQAAAKLNPPVRLEPNDFFIITKDEAA